MHNLRAICSAIVLLLPLIATAQDKAGNTSKEAATLTVAVVSPRCVFGDVNANLAHFTELIEQAE